MLDRFLQISLFDRVSYREVTLGDALSVLGITDCFLLLLV